MRGSDQTLIDIFPTRIWATGNDKSGSWTAEKLTGQWALVGSAPMLSVQYVRADLVPTPLAAALAVPEVAALVEAVGAEIDARQAYEALPVDRGGKAGKKGKAYTKWLQCRADLREALRGIGGQS